MLSLLDLAPELLTQIIENCEDFPQVFAFVSACKRLHSIWNQNNGAIVYAVGKSSISAFDDALMAIRATEVVRVACESKQLPPRQFPFHGLSGTVNKPTMIELKAVFDIQHLARCLAQPILHTPSQQRSLFTCRFDPLNLEAINQNLADWEESFERALYRIVLLGAVCTRAYTEPFFRAAENGDDTFLERWDGVRWNGKVRPSTDDLASIRKYPVWNFDADDESDEGKARDSAYHELFGEFGEMIVKDGKSRQRQISHSQLAPIATEIADIARMMAVFENTVFRIINTDPPSGPNHRNVNPPGFPSGTRKVTVVLFGVFQVEEISMPVNPREARNNFLPSARCFISSPYLLINRLLLGLRYVSDRPETYDGFPAAWPILTFFVFILKNCAKKMFNATCFIESNGVSYFTLANPRIFCQDGGGLLGDMFVDYKSQVMTRVCLGPGGGRWDYIREIPAVHRLLRGT